MVCVVVLLISRAAVKSAAGARVLPKLVLVNLHLVDLRRRTREEDTEKICWLLRRRHVSSPHAHRRWSVQSKKSTTYGYTSCLT